MQYVYHLVPKNLSGKILLPLNRLKETLPDAYSFQVEKYAGREKIMERYVPKLNCLWNDVLHCSSIDPRILFSHLQEIGLGSYSGKTWFKIPISLLANHPTVVYRAPQEPRKDRSIGNEDIEMFDSAKWTEPTSLSPQAVEYFAQCKAGTKPLFAFQFIPHVLIHGEINVENMTLP
jgi:hypothetical protein